MRLSKTAWTGIALATIATTGITALQQKWIPREILFWPYTEVYEQQARLHDEYDSLPHTRLSIEGRVIEKHIHIVPHKSNQVYERSFFCSREIRVAFSNNLTTYLEVDGKTYGYPGSAELSAGDRVYLSIVPTGEIKDAIDYEKVRRHFVKRHWGFEVYRPDAVGALGVNTELFISERGDSSLAGLDGIVEEINIVTKSP